jgi:hypothetical protein
MGLEADIRPKKTSERGIEKVGSTGRIVAAFDQTGDACRQGPTSEFEILRGRI